MTDFNKLIPELAHWNNGNGISIDSWLDIIGSFEHAIAYGNFFWPQFIEYDGSIFRQEIWEAWDERNYQNWLISTKGDKTTTERVMNHLHIYDLYTSAPEATMAQKRYLASLLKEIWECKLKRDFPHLETQVELIDCDGDDEEWADCQITISRIRNIS